MLIIGLLTPRYQMDAGLARSAGVGGAQAVAHGVPAPGALPGAMNKDEGLLVCHALQLAGAALPGSSRQPVILPDAAGRAGHPIVTASGRSLPV